MDVSKFIDCYIKKIVQKPDLVRIECIKVSNGYDYIIWVHPSDMGRVVGKNGSMIASIKAFVAGVRAKNGQFYKVSAKAL
ncbi:MAG: KH domain-containing protein [Helicobacter sp.]|nr:KH domain-containing protein [Helicobacter sp.]